MLQPVPQARGGEAMSTPGIIGTSSNKRLTRSGRLFRLRGVWIVRRRLNPNASDNARNTLPSTVKTLCLSPGLRGRWRITDTRPATSVGSCYNKDILCASSWMKRFFITTRGFDLTYACILLVASLQYSLLISTPILVLQVSRHAR